jgi:hypothetical protein
MFDIIRFTLAANVANAGTVTVGYPTGRSKDSYSLSNAKHVLIVGQNKMVASQDFTIAFNANASNMTVTNASGATWPAGASCILQVERIGDNAGSSLVLSQAIVDTGRVATALPLVLNLGSPNTADADGFFVSQNLTSAGVASVSTTVAAAIAAAALGGVADIPRNVVAAWTGTAVLTVTGTDEYGNSVVESSASGTTFTGKKSFKTVTGISVSANVTSLTVGTGEKLGLPVAVRKAGQITGVFKDGQLVGKGNTGKIRLPFSIDVADLAAGTANAPEFISPIDGVVSLLSTTVVTAIVTGGTVTAKIGTTDIDGLSITVANSATKGTTQTDTPTAAHATTAVAKGDRIQIVPQDAFNGGGALSGYIEITPTDGVDDGTFVASDATEPTATTGDVRGTYTPSAAADGSAGYKLTVLLADPNDLGMAQFAG